MKKFIAILGVSVLTVSLFAGCGSSSDKETTTAAAEETTVAAANAGSAANADASTGSEQQVTELTYQYVGLAKALQDNATALTDEEKTTFATISTQTLADVQTLAAQNDVEGAIAKLQEANDQLATIADAHGFEVEEVNADNLAQVQQEMAQTAAAMQQQNAAAAQ